MDMDGKPQLKNLIGSKTARLPRIYKMKKINLKKIFNKKRVLVTGHTGFKGSWLSLILNYFGATILGVSDSVPTNPSHFKIYKNLKKFESKKVDISNKDNIKKIIFDYKPDFIFHLAAQALVKKSYLNPVKTWRSNTFGTLNILDALRDYKKKVVVVLITSDKVYKNIEKKTGYKETDLLGGKDPYSASKTAAEIVIRSYMDSFLLKKNNLSTVIARAGNVVGGGDWSENRLIPDCVKAWSKNKKVIIRNPNSTRPWQHVLEATMGYIILAASLKQNKNLNGEAFNFGPNTKKNYKVIECVRKMKKYWPSINWKVKKTQTFFESSLLKLNSNKASKILKWKCVLNFEETIKMTTIWYRNFYQKNKKKISINKIKEYIKIYNKRSKIKI